MGDGLTLGQWGVATAGSVGPRGGGGGVRMWGWHQRMINSGCVHCWLPAD